MGSLFPQSANERDLEFLQRNLQFQRRLHCTDVVMPLPHIKLEIQNMFQKLFNISLRQKRTILKFGLEASH